MFDPETLKRALGEIERLNGNLERLHEDAQELRGLHSDVRTLVSSIRDLKDKFKALPFLAKQFSVFNQILLQTGKTAGTAGMIQTILDGLLRMARKSG